MADEPDEYESNVGLSEEMYAYNPQDTQACPSCDDNMLAYFGPNLNMRGVVYKCLNCGYGVKDKDTGAWRPPLPHSIFRRPIGHRQQSLGPGESMDAWNSTGGALYFKDPPTYQNNAKGHKKKRRKLVESAAMDSPRAIFQYAYNPDLGLECPSCGSSLESYFGEKNMAMNAKPRSHMCPNCGPVYTDDEGGLHLLGPVSPHGHLQKYLGPGESMDKTGPYMAPPLSKFKNPYPLQPGESGETVYEPYHMNARGKVKKRKMARQRKALLRPEYHGPAWLQTITEDYPTDTAYMGPSGDPYFRQLWWNSVDAPVKSKRYKDASKAEGRAQSQIYARRLRDSMDQGLPAVARIHKRSLRAARQQARTGYYPPPHSIDGSREAKAVQAARNIELQGGRELLERNKEIQEENEVRRERYALAAKNLKIIEYDMQKGRQVSSEEMNHWQRMMIENIPLALFAPEASAPLYF